jgi:hypothetical protein
MEKLIWFPVVGYEGLYEITKCGKVKSLDKTRIGIYKRNYKGKNLSIVKVGVGYDSVSLSKNGIKKKWLLHRLVAISFLDKIEGKDFVNHKDSNKTNNHVDNLEWVSSIENNCHMQKNRKTSSIYPGVYLHVDKKRYVAQINHNGKKNHLGIFETEEMAYLARVNFELANNIDNKYL